MKQFSTVGKKENQENLDPAVDAIVSISSSVFRLQQQRAAAPSKTKGSIGATFLLALGSSKKMSPADEITLEVGFKEF